MKNLIQCVEIFTALHTAHTLGLQLAPGAHTQCTDESGGVSPQNLQHQDAVPSAAPQNAPVSEWLCPGFRRGALFTQGEEEEGTRWSSTPPLSGSCRGRSCARTGSRCHTRRYRCRHSRQRRRRHTSSHTALCEHPHTCQCYRYRLGSGGAAVAERVRWETIETTGVSRTNVQVAGCRCVMVMAVGGTARALRGRR